jgi:AcrR family transcriptional regulator
MARRGSYAKGVAKRNEILHRALDVVADHGFPNASVRELAEAVDLSQAGLLHYFDSKDDLFTQILHARDESDARHFSPGRPDDADGDNYFAHWTVDGPDQTFTTYLDVIEHNTHVPGLIELFARMEVRAADPANPAHEFFTDRNRNVQSTFVAAFRQLQAAGRMEPDVDVESLARILQAVSDGLQLQRLLEPGLDMAGIVGLLIRLVVPDWDPRGGPSPTPPAEREDT